MSPGPERDMLGTPSAAGDRPRKAGEYFRMTGQPPDPRLPQPSGPKTCQDLIHGVEPTRTSKENSPHYGLSI